MTVIENITKGNDTFSTTRFDPKLRIIPSAKTMLVGCVDPRVDPEAVLGFGLGEAAVIRNVGGRVTPEFFLTMKMLSVVAKAGGGALGPGWNLVVLHHTDCGITRLGGVPELVGDYFGTKESDLDALAISDPRRSVVRDVEALKAEASISSDFTVSGLVYDIATGKIEVIVPPSKLRP